MVEQPFIENEKLISASEATRYVRYTSDYLTRLAREGKIVGQKVGRQWMISPESLQNFIEHTQLSKIERNAKLSLARKLEKKVPTAVPFDTDVSHPLALVGGRVRALTQTLIIVVVGLSLGVASQISFTAPQTASVSMSEGSFFSYVAKRLYTFIHPRTVVVGDTVVSEVALPSQDTNEMADSNADTAVVRSDSYRIEIISPAVSKEAKQGVVERAFSDEVDVLFDTEEAVGGAVIPKFKNSVGNPYRFVLTNPNAPSE